MRKDDARLLDIVLACREATNFVSGISLEQYLGDRKLQAALSMELEIIGEAARSITEEFKNSHSEIPWRQIVSLRNRVVHEYFRLDRNILWEIVQKDVPELLLAITPLTPPENSGK